MTMDESPDAWNSREGLEEEVPPSLVPAFKAALKDLVHQLVIRDYAGLMTGGHASNTTAQQLPQVFAEYYPCTPVDLPDDAWKFASAILVDANPEDIYWHVSIDLWTLEQGRSDLTLEVDVRSTPDGITTRIDDLHVM